MRSVMFCCCVLPLVLFNAEASAAPSAEAVLKAVDKAAYAGTSRMKITQTVVTPSGDTRTFKMVAYAKNGDEMGLTVYVAPNQVRGMKILTLNDGDDIWSYFPRTNRTRKIASSARNRRVQGSDFTYDDMAAGKMAVKWTGEVIGKENLAGKACLKLALRPTAKGPKSYAKITAWVAEADHTMLKVDYYDLDGDNIKRLVIGKYKNISGVMIPFSYEMTNLADGGKTTMQVVAAEVNPTLDPGLFSEAGLSK
ncbi:MAG: outer membrane lipoprotein-sorting protein [Myxococcota bacterium]|nr:outer membrane lipoprotein-sorting protein [Myxococcota bacterium]